MKTQIIPQIREIKILKNTFKLNNFYLDELIVHKLPIANEIFKENEKGEKKYPIIFTWKEMKEESYRIIARSEKIEIIANDNRGLMYALFTLSELAFINDDKLTAFDLYDEPTMEIRALSDDISRGQISTLDHFFSIIRRLARYKYNTYMPYIEDVLKYDAFPTWGKYSQPMSKEEWKIIIEYAKSYQMEVRPIINLLGHFDKLSCLEDFDKYSLKFENGMSGMAMDPKKPEVREMICKILDEVVEVFGPGIIHTGGDEPFALTKIHGEEEGGRLFIEHYTFVTEEVKKRNCSMVMYVDFFAPMWGDYAVSLERIKEMPGDIEFVFWDYDERTEYPFVDGLYEQGVKMYLSPGSWAWRRLSCDMRKSYNNTKGLLKADKKRGLGMIMSTWGDGGDSLRDLAWPGICVGANFCWSQESEYSFEEFYNIFHKSFYGFNPEQASSLDVIYHHDSILTSNRGYEFKFEFYRDPSKPVLFEDMDKIEGLIEKLKKTEQDIKGLVPMRNQDSYSALLLAFERIKFTTKKIADLPHRPIRTLEEGHVYSEVALELAEALMKIKEIHRIEWFKNTRKSEWESCEFLYDQLYSQLQIFAKKSKLRIQFMFDFLMVGEQFKL